MKVQSAISMVLLVIAAAVTGFAQQRGSCGVVDQQPLLDRVSAHQKSLSEHVTTRSSIVKYVPVTFILVADDNGNGRVREEQVLSLVDGLNANYADQDMSFYIDQIKYKDHTLMFTETTNAAAIFQMKLLKDPNSMNIFIVKDANNGGGTPGTTLAYYSSVNDWIVTRKEQVNYALGTLEHEIGHFFSLAHTFAGWECDPYDPDVHGNPVASIWSPCNGSIRNELMDGSNCTTAADRICDTNPDYNFGFGWSVGGDGCAEYTPTVMDYNGDVIDVVENNYMGYFIGCENYEFSPTQKNIIQSDFLSSARAYLRTGYVPTLDTVSEEVSYVYPINGEETGTSGIVDLDWEDVPEATDYLIIVDRSATFSLVPRRFWASESFLTVDGLSPNLTYYWRVWPFNESRTGAGWSPSQSFHTGEVSAVSTIHSVSRLDIFPNPLSAGSELSVAIESDAPFNADFALYDLTGEVVWSRREQQIEAGKHVVVPVSTERLPAGFYILKVQSETGGLISRKVNIF